MQRQFQFAVSTFPRIEKQTPKALTLNLGTITTPAEIEILGSNRKWHQSNYIL